MTINYWAIFGIKTLSVRQTATILSQITGLETEDFIQDYTNLLAISSKDIQATPSFSVAKNRANDSVQNRSKYLNWYEEKFKEYTILAFIYAQNGSDIKNENSWFTIASALKNNNCFDCLYSKETLQ